MRVRWLGSLVLAALFAAAACGTDATGVQTCRDIEAQRCMEAPACGLSLQPPNFTSADDVSACVRFYDDACLHGLSGPAPSSSEEKACIAAIQNDGCAVVAHPEVDPACAWLVPPAPPDAGDGAADAADATSDATAE
jgi:hypothetical protein